MYFLTDLRAKKVLFSKQSSNFKHFTENEVIHKIIIINIIIIILLIHA